MQLPNEHTSYARCITLAHFSETAFESFSTHHPALVQLAASLAEPRMVLEQSLASRDQLERELQKRRFTVGMSDVLSDLALRDLRIAALGAQTDGGMVEELFPKGVGAIVRLRGTSQLGEMRAVEHRLDGLAPKWPAAVEWRQKIAVLREQYAAAIGAVAELADAMVAARVVARNAKAELLLAFARVSGELRRLFPRNTRMQDVFFDRVRAPKASEDDDEGDLDEAADPAA